MQNNMFGSERYESSNCLLFCGSHKFGVGGSFKVFLFGVNKGGLFDVCSWFMFSLLIFSCQ